VESFEAIGKSFAGYGTDAKVSVEGQISRLEGFNKNWEKRVKKNPYFRLYMRDLFKKKEFEPPTLMDSLSRDMGAIAEPNLIYPVGDPVFIHILVEGKNKDLIYKPIEPRLFFNRDWSLAEVEKRIALSIDDTVAFKSVEAKTNYLNELIKNITIVNRKMKPKARNPEQDEDKKRASYLGSEKVTWTRSSSTLSATRCSSTRYTARRWVQASWSLSSGTFTLKTFTAAA